MKKYLRKQMVMADPMDVKTYEKRTGRNPMKDKIGEGNAPGYLVSDISGTFAKWMQKDVFEKSFAPFDTLMDRMNFQLAELTESIEEMNAYLADEKNTKAMDNSMQLLIEAQLSAMQTFGAVLATRISTIINNHQ
jgi:hypothetical protein